MKELDEIEQQIRALQQKMRALKGDEVTSIWAVFDPTRVGVWCPKSECPLSGRRIKLEPVELRADQAIVTTKDGTVPENEETYQVKVLREYGPKQKNHSLGVYAAFRTEEEGVRFILTFYRNKQQEFSEANSEEIPQLELVEIALTESR